MPAAMAHEHVRETAARLTKQAQGLLCHIECSPEVWKDLTFWPTDYCFPSRDDPNIPRVVSLLEDEDCEDEISDICDIRHCSVKRKPTTNDSTSTSTATESLDSQSTESEETPCTPERESPERKRRTKKSVVAHRTRIAQECTAMKPKRRVKKCLPELPEDAPFRNVPFDERHNHQRAKYPIVFEDARRNRYGYV